MLDWPWPFVILSSDRSCSIPLRRFPAETLKLDFAFPVCFIHKAGGIGSRCVEHLNALFFRSALILLEAISRRRSCTKVLRADERKYSSEIRKKRFCTDFVSG